MEKLGQLLKAERERKGLSLHEIGMNLKINPKILKAIEDNDAANLPAKTFLRGFVKSYAQYLRIDVDRALKMFQDEYGSTRPEEIRTVEPKTTISVSPESPSLQTPKAEKPLKKTEDLALPKQSSGRWIQIIVAILILITIAFVVKMIDKYQKESEITQEALPETSPIETTTTTTLMSAQGSDALSTPISTTLPEGGMSTNSTSTSTSTTLAAAAAPTSTSMSTTTVTTTTLRPTTTTATTLKATTTTTTLKPTTTTTTVKPSTTTTTSTTTTILANAPKTVEVIVEALNAVQIKYSLGDEPMKTMELTPDQVHTFKSKKVQIDVSDGGAINVIVNGRDRGVPGTIGKPLKLTFP